MLVRAMRMKSNLKVRQPLSRIILPIADEKERNEVQRMEDVILDEINVKKVEYVTDDSGIVHKKAKANFKSIGPKFGKSVKPVAERIKNMTPAEIAELERNGALTVMAGSLSCTLGTEDVEIIREDIRGWLVESDGTLTVALDTKLDDALIAEGTAREFVNRIQNMRKDAGFEVTDRINIYFDAPENMRDMLESMRAYIQNETLAAVLSAAYQDGEFSSTFDLNGATLRAGIERCAQN
jgi:isoleucyl-tRNA synthetase